MWEEAIAEIMSQLKEQGFSQVQALRYVYETCPSRRPTNLSEEKVTSQIMHSRSESSNAFIQSLYVSLCLCLCVDVD
jgi:hypothetical protein